MEIINNKKHTIIDRGYGVFNYVRYQIYEYYNVINEKEEVKHPTYKKQILKIYGL